VRLRAVFDERNLEVGREVDEGAHLGRTAVQVDHEYRVDVFGPRGLTGDGRIEVVRSWIDIAETPAPHRCV